MADILKPKRGSKSIIRDINPILQEGEVVFEYPDEMAATGRGHGLIKMGDGVTPYNDLPFFITAVLDYIPKSDIGVANGVPPLNEEAIIPAAYLPGYVDDILEYDSFDDFPIPGESGKLYLDKSATTNNIYRWSGTQYVCVAASVTYTLVKDGFDVVLQCSDGTSTKVTIEQIVERANRSSFPTTGEAGKLYVDKSNTNSNLYRWDIPTSSYKLVAAGATYALSKTGHTIKLTGSDGSSSSVTVTEENTTYTLTKSGSTIKLTGSDGASTTVTDSDTHRPIQVNGTQILGSNVNALNLKQGTNVSITNSTGIVTVSSVNTTYAISKSGSAIKLTGSDGSSSSVSGVGGVEIRTTDPSASELYAGKMWIKV